MPSASLTTAGIGRVDMFGHHYLGLESRARLGRIGGVGRIYRTGER
jgi:hypothetical protein